MTMETRVYFDNSATTPTDPRVRDAMLPYLSGAFGNPSSLYSEGREARQAIEKARAEVAALFDGEPDEVIFTGSGTEADNLALKGVICGPDGAVGHVITSAIEHPAVLETCRWLESMCAHVTYLPVNSEGFVSPEDLERAFRPDTKLVSIMAANNVVGTIQPIADLATIAKRRGVLFHTDAVQAAGKIPLSLKTLPADLISLSAHKLHGPKGVGALVVRRGVRLSPIVHGGGQEKGIRSATENVAGIVGFGEAARLAREEMAQEAARLVNLREKLVEGILAALPNAYLIGHRYKRLPGHLSIGLAGQEQESIRLMLALDAAGFAVSTGSACSASNTPKPSYVLEAMGLDPVRARGLIRITLGRFNTEAEVDRFLAFLPVAAGTLGKISTRRS
jgi:cysteine desulfurase